MSLRFMAEAWGWSLAAVQRFIERLKTDTMIDTATDTGQVVITICNYNRYQAGSDAGGTASDTATGTEAIQDRYKEEIRKEGNKDSIDQTDLFTEEEPKAKPENLFDQWWALVPRKVSKGQAEKAFAKALKLASPETLMDGMRRYGASVAESDPKFIKHPATWLNGKCWLDDQPGDEPAPQGQSDYDRDLRKAMAFGGGSPEMEAFLAKHRQHDPGGGEP